MISVSISRAELVVHNACAGGLALFDSILAMCGPKSRAKGRIYIREWTPLHCAWLYSRSDGWAAWCAERGIIPRANLDGAYLDGANLDGANRIDSPRSGARFLENGRAALATPPARHLTVGGSST